MAWNEVTADRGRSPTAQRVLRDLLTAGVLATAYLGAYLIRFEFAVPAAFLRVALITLPVVVVGKMLILRLLGAHKHSWRFTSLWDVVAIGEAMLASALLLAGLRLIGVEAMRMAGASGITPIPLGVIAADLALSVVGLVGIRALRRLQHEEAESRRLRASGGRRRRRTAVVIGAGRAGSLVAREIQTRPDLGLRAVGFIDDDPHKQHQVIHGLEVLGTRDELADVVAERGVDQAIIAISDATGPTVRDLVERCRAVGIEAQIIPGVYELIGGQVKLSRLRPVRIEDLLRREPVELDTSSIEALVRDGTVLVTGAGGSIGAELCRQLARYRPRRLVLAEQSEGALWAIHRELAPAHPDVEVVPAIGDVCDARRVEALIAHERPTLVFHAAAHKHVPMMEANPGEAVKNNVFGTKVVADACAQLGVDRFVLVSTDKAVNPSSVMGATKRVAERYVHHLAQTTGRVFVSVRFGNVLGSAGSVVPVFEQQIADGGPVTVTHPDMTRYFMTIPEASQLVIQAAALGTGGEVFVLDMGEPVRIVDLARDLIRLSGLEPGADIDVVYTGMRPGEKLFEELALDTEDTDRTSHPSIAVSRSATATWAGLDGDLERLRLAAETADRAQVRAALGVIVPEMVGAAVVSGRAAGGAAGAGAVGAGGVGAAGAVGAVASGGDAGDGAALASGGDTGDAAAVASSGDQGKATASPIVLDEAAEPRREAPPAPADGTAPPTDEGAPSWQTESISSPAS
jgi:FlaA1/EpsC-like NDP-sugar epimerase